MQEGEWTTNLDLTVQKELIYSHLQQQKQITKKEEIPLTMMTRAICTEARRTRETTIATMKAQRTLRRSSWAMVWEKRKIQNTGLEIN